MPRQCSYHVTSYVKCVQSFSKIVAICKNSFIQIFFVIQLKKLHATTNHKTQKFQKRCSQRFRSSESLRGKFKDSKFCANITKKDFFFSCCFFLTNKHKRSKIQYFLLDTVSLTQILNHLLPILLYSLLFVPLFQNHLVLIEI